MKIEYAYVSEEIKNVYEKQGGFAQGNKLVFLGFLTDKGFITGIHMRGGLYGQIHRRFYIFCERTCILPKQFYKFLRKPEDLSYCGISATNISGFHFRLKKYKQPKREAEKEGFINLLEMGIPLFQFEFHDEYQLNSTLIDYELSTTLAFH